MTTTTLVLLIAIIAGTTGATFGEIFRSLLPFPTDARFQVCNGECRYYIANESTGGFYNISGSGGATRLKWSAAEEDLSKVIEFNFSFPFFGGTYTSAAVNENGYITFGELAFWYQNLQCPFDDKASHQNIAAMWTDLSANSSMGTIHWQEFSLCPIAPWTSEKCAIVQWTDVPFYGQPSKSSGAWQIVLAQDGDIALQYNSVAPDELLYTTGIKSSAGGTWNYFSYACNTGAPLISAGKRLVFTWAPLKTCNNTICEAGENCVSCPRDCPAPCNICGDHNCSASAGESCLTCAEDCGACCGDGVCGSDENCVTCPQDCPAPCCGDGTCNGTETGCSCPSDCSAQPCCGDGNCSTSKGESCVTCLADCQPPRSSVESMYARVTGGDAWMPGVPTTNRLPAVNSSALVVTLPFTFTYFQKHSFSRVTVSSKGALWFGADASVSPIQQCPLTNAGAVQYLIAPFFADLYFGTGSNVSFANVSNCGSGQPCFVVQYQDMAVRGISSVVSFQVVLYANGKIAFHYDQVPANTPRVTVGLKGVIDYGVSWGYDLEYCDGSGPIPGSSTSISFTYTGCGDLVCTPAAGENCLNCLKDCPAPCNLCGDGSCNATTETCQSCSSDCGTVGMDSDLDGVLDCADGCPFDGAKTSPGLCGCGKSEKDTDKDGVPDCVDLCPTNPSKTTTRGLCGCQMSDIDSDGDGVLDCFDACPNDPKKNLTVGYCGCGNLETDSDGDKIPNCVDGCPLDPNKVVAGFCGCSFPETDDDHDGWPNCVDTCPNSSKGSPGQCGCYMLDTDTDHDGLADCVDPCPTMYNVTPTSCGCGVPVSGDSDNDGAPDCADRCPYDPKKADPGFCGCGNLETDTDGDGVPDCKDGCPLSPNKVAIGFCGCGTSETDTDGDGIPDCVDQCPFDPSIQYNASDRDGDSVPDCMDQCPDDPTKSKDVDSDGDKVVDCVDGCPIDAQKAQPLFCGCGAIDPMSTAGLEKSPEGLSMQARKKDITCNGLKDGYIAAAASGGTGIYNYSLSCTPVGGGAATLAFTFADSGQAATFGNQSAGVCALKVLDTNGCRVDWPQLLTFTVPSVMSITSDKADEGACEAGAAVLVTVTGGMAPHQFLMMGAGYSQTSGAFSGLPAGQYQIRVTDSRGCTIEGALHSIIQWSEVQCAAAIAVHASWITVIATAASVLFFK